MRVEDIIIYQLPMTIFIQELNVHTVWVVDNVVRYQMSSEKQKIYHKNKPYFNEDIFLYLLYKKSKKKYYQYLKDEKKIKREQL